MMRRVRSMTPSALHEDLLPVSRSGSTLPSFSSPSPRAGGKKKRLAG